VTSSVYRVSHDYRIRVGRCDVKESDDNFGRSRKEPERFEEEEIRMDMTGEKVKEMLMTETFYYPSGKGFGNSHLILQIRACVL
jgi:hypothetical protein